VLGYKEIFSKILFLAGVIHIAFILPLTYFYSEIGAATSVLITEIIVTSMMLFVIIKKNIPLFKGDLDAV